MPDGYFTGLESYPALVNDFGVFLRHAKRNLRSSIGCCAMVYTMSGMKNLINLIFLFAHVATL